MATRKPAAKKRKSTSGCLPTTIILTLLVAISLGATFYFLFLRPSPGLIPERSTPAKGKPLPSPVEHVAGPPVATVTSSAQQTPEEIEKAPGNGTTKPDSPPADARPSASHGRPRIAIIIDDIGNNNSIAEQIIALDLPLSFSIIPHTPHANHLAGLISARGRDTLIHIPMEAHEAKLSRGDGMLLLSMTPEILRQTIRNDLNTPFKAIGINNHMGSKFTEDPDAMRLFLLEVKSRNLFFIDSYTATTSKGYDLARTLGVKTAKRDIFLDNDQDPTQTLALIGRLISLAQRYGTAIGIGHPYPSTLEALRAAAPRLKEDVSLVPAHELVE